VLASTLREDGMPDDLDYNPQADYPRMRNYEYVMAGKVYRIEGDEQQPGGEMGRLSMYVSFGGLLMRLQGNASTMEKFELDSHVYLLMKKVPF
jgi:DNA-directed RNA polymerase I, II, and III subunit RPABC3